MNPFSLSGLALSLICTFLVFVILRSARSKLHYVWALFNISVAMWGLGSFFMRKEVDPHVALFWIRFAHVGVIFLAVFFFHVVYLVCRISNRRLLLFVYYQAIFFAIMVWSNVFISSKNIEIIYNSFYYDKAHGFFYPAFFSIWLGLMLYGHIKLFTTYLRVAGFKKTQILYFLFAMIVGFSGGLTNFFPVFNISIYPIGNFTISLYCLIITYATLRYRLMDISIAITRTGIFVAVYSLVLGIPFALAFGWQKTLEGLLGNSWWMVPLVTSTILATAGPFIYLFIQKRAEARLFQEQARYQTTLRQASLGMGRIKDLKRLVTLIVHIVTRTVRVDHTIIYIKDRRTKNFLLGAVRSRQVRFSPQEAILQDSPLVHELNIRKIPIVYDEIQQQTKDFGDMHLARVEADLKALDAALVVPSFIDDEVVGIIILGKKASGRPYSTDDITVFSILANQAALAIENAQFYDEMKQTHEQLFKAEKMATIGTMADGLSHQINNRLHALGFIAGDALDTVRLKKDVPMTSDIKEVMVDIEHALVRIQENVTQGGEIVQGLLKYTRKGEEGFAEVELERLVNAALEMTQFKIKHGEMKFAREYKADLPKIKGNFTQLQEVFFNLIDNAYDAMMQKKHEIKDKTYEPMIRVFATHPKSGTIEIIVEDNGIGIKDEEKEKLFTPFFTTKLSSKKGTGLGLYVIRKLIEENHGGKVSYVSRYMQGTRVYITLPTADAASS